jgi:hypothetical protein
MEKKEQTMRYSDDELSLIKETFKDNLPLLKAIRKVFLQLELSETEDIMIKKTIKGEVFDIIKKEFLPEIDGDAPLGQVTDLMLSVNIDNRNPVEAILLMKSRQKMIKYLEQQLSVLGGESINENIELLDMIDLEKDVEETYPDVIARNTIVLYVENRLQDLKTLSSQEPMTPEEEAKAQEQNSNK